MSSKNLISNYACIYCSNTGPFTAEHVIPAALGGDDKRFMLRGMVCKNCNTTIFSPLEAEFSRKTPAALSRIFLQPEGRRRGKKTNPPKLEAKSKTLISSGGYQVEIELGKRAKPSILPQFMLAGERDIKFTGSDEASLRTFISEAQALFLVNVTCIRNELVEGVRSLLATTYIWETDTYVEAETCPVSTPSTQNVWTVVLEPNKDGSEPNSRARMFQRDNGQIILRVTEDLGVAKALTFFRMAAERVDYSTLTAQDIVNPLVHLAVSFNVNVIGRVLAKVGMNLLAHLVGSDYVRHPQFQWIKRAILTGGFEIPLLRAEYKPVIAAIFSGLPITKHGFMIAAEPGPSRTCRIAIVARLYGSQIEMITLGEGLPWPNLPQHTFFTVDYQTHRIERYSMLDFVHAFPFEFAHQTMSEVRQGYNPS